MNIKNMWYNKTAKKLKNKILTYRFCLGIGTDQLTPFYYKRVISITIGIDRRIPVMKSVNGFKTASSFKKTNHSKQ